MFMHPIFVELTESFRILPPLSPPFFASLESTVKELLDRECIASSGVRARRTCRSFFAAKNRIGRLVVVIKVKVGASNGHQVVIRYSCVRVLNRLLRKSLVLPDQYHALRVHREVPALR